MNKISMGVIAVLAAVFVSACGEAAVQPQASTPAQAESPLAITAQDPALQWGPCPDIFPAGCQIAVLHGNPTQPGADVFLRVPANYAIPAHSHTSAERMVLASGQLDVQYQGAAATTLVPGEYAYGPAGLPHRATCVSTDPCVLFIAFVEPVDAVAFTGALE